MAGWERIEAMGRGVGLDSGLEARIADPLWLLARQWQVGEFHGDDAAQPAAARVSGRTIPLTSFRPGGRTEPVAALGEHTGGPNLSGAVGGAGRAVPLPSGQPLEALAEAVSEPESGAAGLYASARAGRRLARMLGAEGLGAGAAALRDQYRPARPEHPVAGGPNGSAAIELLVLHGLDGAAVAADEPARVTQVLATVLAGDALAHADVVVTAWRAWYQARKGPRAALAWDEERVEYRFSVAAAGPEGEVTIVAPGHDGGHLDWASFDLGGGTDAHGLGKGTTPARVHTAVPTPVRYSGMPASRLWEMEDGEVHFGDPDAGPADLARLLVAEFATVYGDDMFVIPIQVHVGSLTELRSIEVIDTFGGRTDVHSTARVDAADGRERTWRLFELSGDEVDDHHPSPWLLVPPTVAGELDSRPLERVALARDEAANLAWGIEHLVEGPLGRAVDRAEAYAAAHPGPPPAAQPAAPRERWRYELEATVPPWWVPLVPERIDPDAQDGDESAQVRLRRARMRAWELLGRDQVGAHSELLDPGRPRFLAEEQVTKAGLQVERAWQLGRWHDGSLHLWLHWRTMPGRGESASGLRWDLLQRDEPTVG